MTESNQVGPRPTAVRMRNIRKTFGKVAANDGINLEIQAGEIYALLGENGAGKSTLMNILYGLIEPNEGHIEIHGKPVSFSSPSDATACGIAMVHQHFMLVPNFTVIENIILGLGTPSGPMLSLAEPTRRIQQLSDAYGLKVDPKVEIAQLSVGEQQRVEIIKALYRNADILILDEPTSVLTPQEVEQLFEILRAFVRDGHTVIFISHKLHEVLSISNHITVLRDGKVIGTLDTKNSTKSELARLMVGREIEFDFGQARKQGTYPVLEIKNISIKNDRDLTAVTDISLTVRSGEVLGIAGVDGNGQRELAEALVGLIKVQQGKILLEGEEITNKSPKNAIQRGIAYIPPDRRESALLPNLEVWRSLLLGAQDREPYAKKGMLQQKTIQQMVARLIKQFDVRPANPHLPASSLSGGNQQKLLLAREIDRKPKLIIACQPTLGLDIQTTEYVRKLLLEQRDEGAAVLLVSVDLQEILAVSDRIAVMHAGKVMGIVPAQHAAVETLGLMMAGIPLAEHEVLPEAVRNEVKKYA